MSRKSERLFKDKFDFDVSAIGEEYIDEQSDNILTAAVLGGRSKSMFSIQEGVKGKEKIKIIDDNVVFQDASSCGNDPSGNTTFSDKTIETVRLEVFKGYCVEDLIGKWTQIEVAAGAMNQDSDLPFEGVLTAYFLQQLEKEHEGLLVQGDTSLPSGNKKWINGIKKLVADGSGVLDYTPSGGTQALMTVSNAETIFMDLHDSIPQELFQYNDLAIFCGYDHLQKYKRNVSNLNKFHYEVNNGNPANPYDHPLFSTSLMIHALPGLNNQDLVFACRKSNIVIGVDLQSDDETYDMWYEKKDDKIYIRAKFRLGVQTVFNNEIIKYEEALS